MKHLTAIALILAGVLLGGCEFPSFGGSGSDGPAAPPVGRIPPAAMVQRAIGQRAQLSTLHASAAMQVVDTPADFGLRVNTEIYAGLGPERLRIRATKASVDAFDALLGNGRIAFYVPRKRTLYQGALEDLDASKMAFHPRDILTNLLSPDQHLLQREWTVKYERMEFEEIGAAVVLQERAARPSWVIYLDPKTHLLLAVEELDPSGQIIFAKIYDRYRSIVQGDTISGGKAIIRYYPYRVRLLWPQMQRSVEVNFRSVEPNIEFPESWALLDLPEGVEIRDIAQARVEGDRLQEMEGVSAPEPTPIIPGPAEDQGGTEVEFHGVAQ